MTQRHPRLACRKISSVQGSLRGQCGRTGTQACSPTELDPSSITPQPWGPGPIRQVYCGLDALSAVEMEIAPGRVAEIRRGIIYTDWSLTGASQLRDQ